MKVWRFYLKPDEKIGKRKYDLYATTGNKKHAKKFMKERNMDKFIVRCSDEDREDFIKFVNDNRSILLDYHTYDTRTLDEKNKYRAIEVEILSTDYESQCCDSDVVMTDILSDGDWEIAPPYNIFKNKIIDSLRTLEYVNSYKIYRMNYNDTVIDPDDDDYEAPNLWVDEFGIFLRTFGYTFK